MALKCGSISPHHEECCATWSHEQVCSRLLATTVSTARKHHYVPKSYLAAWTQDGTIDGQLLVVDKQTGKDWSVKPVNAAKETDLYMIDVADTEGEVSATSIEADFGRIEDEAAPIVKRVLAGEALPYGSDRVRVLTLLATLVVRVPSRLKWLNDVLREGVELVHKRMDASGELESPENPALAAQMKDWLDRGLIKVTIKQNAVLGHMVSMLPTLLNLLSLRRWTVLRTRPDAGDLVCTDHPVLLEWIKQPQPGASPGFGIKNTAVFVPIGPSAALLGLWDAEPKDVTLTRNQVAFWNGELLGYASRFVFSRDDFEATRKNGAIDRRKDVIRILGSEK